MASGAGKRWTEDRRMEEIEADKKCRRAWHARGQERRELSIGRTVYCMQGIRRGGLNAVGRSVGIFVARTGRVGWVGVGPWAVKGERRALLARRGAEHEREAGTGVWLHLRFLPWAACCGARAHM
eukprot:3105369-Prymnesium_polylepis.1